LFGRFEWSNFQAYDKFIAMFDSGWTNGGYMPFDGFRSALNIPSSDSFAAVGHNHDGRYGYGLSYHHDNPNPHLVLRGHNNEHLGYTFLPIATATQVGMCPPLNTFNSNITTGKGSWLEGVGEYVAGGSITFNVFDYSRVGNLVFITLSLNISGSGRAYIYGIPISSKNLTALAVSYNDYNDELDTLNTRAIIMGDQMEIDNFSTVSTLYISGVYQAENM
jgi:hypothetical protein